MKKMFVFVVITLASTMASLAGNARASEVLYYYNGEGMSVAVSSDGSAHIQETCGQVEISHGWNTRGETMHGESTGGPVSTFSTPITLTATQSRRAPNSIQLRLSDEPDAITLTKSDKPSVFEICL